MSRFTELAPFSVSEQLSELKTQVYDQSIIEDTVKWLNSSFQIVRKYFYSIAVRNKELEDFIHQTMKHLEETERHLSDELSSQQNKFNEDRDFENSISENMNMIQKEFKSGDFESIKLAVISKIENINNSIDKKREQDMFRLKETQKKLEQLNSRINDITREADEIKRKAQELEIESFHDELTGLNNRKAYDNEIIKTIADLKRYNTPVSLMVCDIDNFKKVNDVQQPDKMQHSPQ